MIQVVAVHIPSLVDSSLTLEVEGIRSRSSSNKRVVDSLEEEPMDLDKEVSSSSGVVKLAYMYRTMCIYNMSVL